MDRRSFALLITGVAIGALLVSPVGAHVTDSLDHLWNGDGHIKDKVQNLGDDRYLGYGTNNPLPPGKSLTGTIIARVQTANEVGVDSISFGGRLSFEPNPEIVVSGDNTPSAHCPGTAARPKASPGYLCIYTASIYQVPNDTWAGVWDVVTGQDCGCRRGAVVYISSKTQGAEASGTWAVTAPNN